MKNAQKLFSALRASGLNALAQFRMSAHDTGADFDAAIRDHLDTGLVVVMPDTFLLAKAADFGDGRKAWLVTHAIGPLSRLVRLMPVPLPFVAFRRRGAKRYKFYNTARFIHLAQLLRRKS